MHILDLFRIRKCPKCKKIKPLTHKTVRFDFNMVGLTRTEKRVCKKCWNKYP